MTLYRVVSVKGEDPRFVAVAGGWLAQEYPLQHPSRTETEQEMPGILVGFDGSDHAVQALEWAMKEAAGPPFPAHRDRRPPGRHQPVDGQPDHPP
jgi:hypothetical protein